MAYQITQESLNVGRLTKSLAHNIHNDYAKLLLSFKSMSGSSGSGSLSDDYNKKK